MEEGGQRGRDTTMGWEENRAGEKRGREGGMGGGRSGPDGRSGTRERT
jgi:hypothetical protein